MKKNDSFRKKMLMSSFLLGLFLVLFGFSAKGQSSYVVLDEGFDKAPANVSLKSGFGTGTGVWFDTIVSTPVGNPGNWIISGWGTPTASPSISTNQAKGVLKFGYTSNGVNKDTVTPFITTCPIDLKDAETFNLHLHCFADGGNVNQETLEIYLDDKLVKEISINKIYKVKTSANIVSTDLFNTVVLDGLDATGATDTSRITMKITGYGLTKNIRVGIYLDRMIVTKGVDGSPYPTSITIDNVEKYTPAPDTLPYPIYDLRNFAGYYGHVFPTGTTGTKPVRITAQPDAKIKVTQVEGTVTNEIGGTGSLTFDITVPGRANVEILSPDSLTTASYTIGVVDAVTGGRIGTQENPYTPQDILYYGKYAVYGTDVNGENKYWVRGYVKGDVGLNNGNLNGTTGVIRIENSTAKSGINMGTAISIAQNPLLDTMMSGNRNARIVYNADSVLPCGYYMYTEGRAKELYDLFSGKGAVNYVDGAKTSVYGKDILFYGFSTPRWKPGAMQWLVGGNTPSWEYTSLDSVSDYFIYEPLWDSLKINGTPYAHFNKNVDNCVYGYQQEQAFPTVSVIPNLSTATVSYVPEGGIPTSWDDTVKITISYLGADKNYIVTFKGADTTLIDISSLKIINGTGYSSTGTKNATSGLVIDGDYDLTPAFNKNITNYTLNLAAKQNNANPATFAIGVRINNSEGKDKTDSVLATHPRMTLVTVSNVTPITPGATKAVQIKEIAEDTTYQRIYTINITAEDTSHDASIYKVNSLEFQSDTIKSDGSRSSTKEFGQTYEPSTFKTLLRTNVPDTIKVKVPFNKKPQVYVSQTILTSGFELYMDHPNAVAGGLERVDNLYKDPGFPNYFEHYILGVVLKANESAIYRAKTKAEDGVTEGKSVYVQVTRLPNDDPSVDSAAVYLGGTKVLLPPGQEPKTYTYTVGNSITSLDSIVGYPKSYGKVRLDTVNNADSTIWWGGGQVATIVKPELQTNKDGFINEYKLYSVAQDGIARDTITVFIERESNRDSATQGLSVMPFSDDPEFLLMDSTTLQEDYFDPGKTAWVVYANTTDFPLYISTIPTNSAASSIIDTVYAADVEEGKYEDKSLWHPATVYTIAEDGTENPVHYTVYVGHISSNNYLSDLKVGGTTIAGFDKDTLIYNYAVIGTTVPTVTAIEESQYADDPVVTSALNIGDTTFVTVTAQSGEERIYKIAMLFGDTTLGTLEVVGQTLTPGFASNRFEYTVSGIERNITEVTVNATVNESHATILNGIGNISLTGDTTTNVVTVRAQSGDLGHYTITLIRPKSTDTTLSALSVDGVSVPNFLSSEKQYTVTGVERDVTTVTIGATANSIYADTVTGTGIIPLELIGNTDTTIAEVVVTAENGATGTYTITLVRRPVSTDATLSALSVDGVSVPNFNPAETEYTITGIAQSATTVTIAATANSIYADTVTGTGVFTLNTSNDTSYVYVTVTAEDLTTTKTYTIELIKIPFSTDTTLSALSVDGVSVPDFNPAEDQYTVTGIERNVVSVSVAATATHEYAEVAIDGVLGSPKEVTLAAGDTTTCQIVVTAENGTSTGTYTITLVRRPVSTDATLSALSVDGVSVPNFNPAETEYTITGIERDVTTVTMAATANSIYADTVTGTGVFTLNPLSDTNYAEVVVTAENGATGTYTITLVRRPVSTDATLRALGVTDYTLTPAFASDKVTYTVSNIARNAENVTVTATATATTYAEVKIDGVVGNQKVVTLTGEATTCNVLVTAEDGSTKTYTITLNKRAIGTDATLSALVVADYELTPVFAATTKKYTVIDVEGSSVRVTATATDANAEVKIDGVVESPKAVALTGDTTRCEIVVTAEDGTTTETYTVTLIKKVTGVEDVKDLENISLYPNPVADVVSVNLEKAQGKVTFSFYNAAGALISTKVVNGGSVQTIDVSKLATGTYSVVIATEKGSVTKKIVKQ